MRRVELLIIGAGPAGLSAAIYAGRAGVETLVLGCPPKVAGDYDIDNYFGFEETISGKELIFRGRRQADRFGSEIVCERVLSVYPQPDGVFKITTDMRQVEAVRVILATGISRMRPVISNFKDYEGKGVSYCVSCDGFFFRNKKTVVLGEGNFAANQGLELLQYTPDVKICTEGKPLAMGDSFRSRLEEAGVEIVEKKIRNLVGESTLSALEFADGTRIDTDGLFVAIGEASSTDFAVAMGAAMNGQFINVDNDQRTNIPGLFAAGDCTGGFLQIAVSVGEGAKAGHTASQEIKKLRKGAQ